MAGLLDMFQNLAPEQNRGLLAAAAQILQASGPQRMPVSLGQIVGSGVEAYQNAMDRGQMAKFRGLQIQNIESDNELQKAQRERAAALRNVSSDYWKGASAPAAQMPRGQSAAAVFDGLMQVGSQQPLEQPAAAAAPSAAGGRQNAYQQRLAYAQYLRSQGYGPEAQAEEEAALKLQPKVKEWKPLNVNGKIMAVPLYENDGYGEPVPYEVAEKLHFENTGKKTLGVNPYTGAQVSSYTNTMTPDGEAADLRARQGNALKAQEIAMGGKPPPGYRWTASGELEPIPGGPASLAQKLAKAPTEFQGKSAVYGARAEESDRIVSSLKYDPAAIASKSAVEDTWLVGPALGAAVNKFALSANDQKAEQAQRDFISAILRQESGAAIADSEYRNARRQYFPEVGDSAEKIAQKARNRKIAIQGLKQNAGPAAYSAEPEATRPDAQTGTRKSAIPGQVLDGYRFKGGNPADPNSWEKL